MKTASVRSLRLAELATLCRFYGAPRRMRRGISQEQPLLVGQRGQAITEYLIVFVLAVIPLLGFTTPLRLILRAYLRDIYFVIGLSVH